MNITAEQTRRLTLHNQIIDSEVKKLLECFEEKIRSVSKKGSTSTVVPVPTTFDVGHMKNSDAQTVIYYKLIKELENKGFDFVLKKGSSTVNYHISWSSKQNEQDLGKMTDVIASYLTKGVNKKPIKKRSPSSGNTNLFINR
jgi:hypothetical protein